MMETLKKARSVSGVVSYGATILCFVIFGLMPLYWASLRSVPSAIILQHRAFWILACLLPYILIRTGVRQTLSRMKKNGKYILISSAALAVNWFGYVYAINHGLVIEAGLAYYISPILSIAFAIVFFKELTNKKEVAALSLVVCALTLLLLWKGVIPKYSLAIGVSFAVYGALSRLITLSTVERLVFESALIFTGFSLFVQGPIESYKQFISYTAGIKMLLIGSGVTTIASFALYIFAVKRVKFGAVGVLGFILPSIIFMLGLFYFHEPLDIATLSALFLIWIGVGIYIHSLCKPSLK